jgi:hypothetical protein
LLQADVGAYRIVVLVRVVVLVRDVLVLGLDVTGFSIVPLNFC